MPEADVPADPRRSHHDMGGRPAGPIEPSEHDCALWEKRADAILSLLFNRGLMTVDEMRRNIEDLGPDAYERMSYYERWIEAAARTMIERGFVTVDELGRKMAEVQGRSDAGP